MNLKQKISYRRAYQHAHKGVQRCMQVIIEKPDGTYKCMSHKLWRTFRPRRLVCMIKKL